MTDTIRIKRRAVGGAAGAPATLAAAEVAYNEVDNTLYYGGGNSANMATTIFPIAGPGLFASPPAIGSTTPNTGTFSTLTSSTIRSGATTALSLGTATNGEVLRLNDLGAARTSHMEMNFVAGSNTWQITPSGSASNLALVATGGGVVTLLASSGTQFGTGNVSGAVNYLQASGSTGTGPVILGATGSATNLDIALVPKGAGSITGVTATLGDSSTKLATTAFVANAVATGGGAFLPLSGGTVTGALTVNGAFTAVASRSPAGLTVDANGNAGLGVVPPVGQAAAGVNGGWLFNWGITTNNWASNLYYDGTNFRYIAANTAWYAYMGGTSLQLQSAPTGAVGAIATLTTRFTVDNAGNIAAGNSATAPGGFFTSSGLFQIAPNYYMQRNGSDGYWRWVNNGTVFMSCSPSGDFSAIGSITATGQLSTNANLLVRGSSYPCYTVAPTYILYGSGANLYHQYQTNWFWQWNNSSGDLLWYNGSYGATLIASAAGQVYNNYSYVAGRGPYQDWSDERMKLDIEPTTYGLDAVLAINPIRFIRKPRPLPKSSTAKHIERTEIGFSAQQVQSVIPEAVGSLAPKDAAGNDEEPMLTIATTPIVAALVNAVKELVARVVALEGA